MMGRGLLLAQLADELQAVHVRQAQIDDGHVDGIVGGVMQCHLGAVGAVYLILGFGQQGAEMVIEQLVVFDQQYFHKVRDHGDPGCQLEGL